MDGSPTVTVAWLLIGVSGLFEIAFSGLMKASDGFTRLVPSLLSFAMASLSVWIMTISLRTLALGPAYAVWAGIGTIGTAAISIAVYGESFTLAKASCIALIVVGIVGLQWLGVE